jgi:hypothetical protein
VIETSAVAWRDDGVVAVTTASRICPAAAMPCCPVAASAVT